MKKHIFQNLSWGIYISLMLSSCSNDSNEVITPAEEDVYLKVVTSMGETRNVITSSTFSSGDAIGLFLRDSRGGNDGSNIKATYSSNQWNLAEKIRVGYYEESTPLTVYAYYPYKSGIGQHGDSIDIDISYVEGSGQPDYLYGSCANIYKDNPTAHIYFKHALARLTLSITNPTKNDAKVSEVTLTEYYSNFTTKARMCLKDGGIKKLSGDTTLEVPVDMTIPKGETRDIDILVLPNSTSASSNNTASVCQFTRGVVSGDLTIAFVIANFRIKVDGDTYSFSKLSPAWYANQQYTYPVTLPE